MKLLNNKELNKEQKKFLIEIVTKGLLKYKAYQSLPLNNNYGDCSKVDYELAKENGLLPEIKKAVNKNG